MKTTNNRRNIFKVLTACSAGLVFRQGEGDGDAGGAPEIDVNSPAFKALLDAALIEKTKGISEKNTELLTKLAASKKSLEAFGDQDPETIKSLLDNLNKSESAKLIAEGKIDEVLAKRTDALTASYEEALKKITGENEESKKSAEYYKAQFEQKTINDFVKEEALKQGIIPAALGDVAAKALQTFQIDSEGNLEARDSAGQLLKNKEGNLVNPENFVKGLAITNPYYWAPSSGSGASGSGGHQPPAGDPNARLNAIASSGGGKINMADYRKARKEQSGDNYAG